MTHSSIHDAEAGAIAPLVALLAATLFGFAGLVVDMGLIQYERRSLQASVDAAALSAARAIAQAPGMVTSIATTTQHSNGKATDTPQVAIGIYVDNPALAAAQRFVPGGTSGMSGTANAVRVTAQRDVSLNLVRVLGGPATAQVSASAIAAHQPLAAFSIGSGVAAVNGGVLGNLLGLGSLSLSAVSYSGLAASNVRVLALGDALATQIGLGAGTYQQLLNSQASVGQILGIAASVLAPSSDSSAATSLNILSQSNQTVRVGDLLGLAMHQTRRIGDFAADQSYMSLGVNALDLVAAAASLGGANAATVPVGLTVPGVASTTVRVMVVEPPQGNTTGATGMGPVGSTAQTAQVRALLSVQLLPLAGSGGIINLPLLVEAAPAQAELTSISCQSEPGTDTALRIQATTGVARAQIGQITPAQFGTPGQTFGTLAPVPIVTVSLIPIPALPALSVGVTVTARADASIGVGSAELSFTSSDITAGTVRTISASGLTGSLIGSLGSSLVLTTTLDLGLIPTGLLGTVNALLGPLLSTLLSGVFAALTPVLNLLDSALDPALAAAGVKLGIADVRATGVRCGIPALVL